MNKTYKIIVGIVLFLLFIFLGIKAYCLDNVATISTNTISTNVVKHKASNIGISKLIVEGFLNKDSDGIEYELKIGLGIKFFENELYSRIAINNSENDLISLLEKLDIKSMFGSKIIYPFAVLGVDYINGDQFRFLQGVGFTISLFKNRPINFSISSGINITEEVYTGLPDVVCWFRSRAKAEINLSKRLLLSASAVISIPTNSELNKWYDYIGCIEIKLSPDVSLVGEMRFFDHKVLNVYSEIDHQVKIRVKI